LSQFHSYIETISPLSADGWEALTAATTPLVLSKGASLLKEGYVCNSICFIEQGYCKAYYISDGLPINTNFFFENDFATNAGSLISGARSAYNIEACEQMQVISLDKSMLLAAYAKSHEVETLGRKILELITSRQEQHGDMLKLLNAEQRYLYLSTHNQELLQRVSLSQLASYIGVTRETLSRVRRKLAQK
jgi:CRP-like cAMP-binding protein